jgi:FtsH-binding integral membrane protein
MDASTAFDVKGRVNSKFLSVVFLYMFIGLLITALVSLGYSYGLLAIGGGSLTDTTASVALISAIVAMVATLIDQVVMSIVSAKTGRAPWVGYILYAVFTGVIGSLILLAGFDFGTIAEAFGLTALVFLVMFLIGYLSPVNLNIFLFLALGLLFGVLLASLGFGIWFLLAPSQGTYILYNFLISLGIIVYAMLITGWDANNMAKIVEKGAANTNIALYCAFSFYTDFILIFVRVLYILFLAKNRN